MSKLIDELKADHAKLVETMDAVKKAGLVTEEGKKLLMAAKTALLAHLDKEDKFLYPPMREAGAKDESVKRMNETFAADMDKVSKAAMDFFAKYSSASATGLEFGKELGQFLAVLKSRVIREESILYPAFDKLPAK